MNAFSSIFPSFLECSVFPPLSVSIVLLLPSLSFHVQGLPLFFSACRPRTASLCRASLSGLSYLLTENALHKHSPFIQHHRSFNLFAVVFFGNFCTCTSMCLYIVLMHFTAHPFPINRSGQVVSVGSHKHRTLSGSISLTCGCCFVSV